MQITELAAKVQTLGLSDKEAKVYVASLFLGPASVQKIAEQADINRATAYVILDQLASLGLVAQSTEGKKTVFVAEGPEMLQRLFDHQLQAIEERRKELDLILPELQQNQRAETSNSPVVRFYKGRDGVDNMIREQRRHASPNTEAYGLVNFDEVEKIVPEIFKTNTKSRVKKNLSSKIIYSYRKDIPSDPQLLRETQKISKPIMADITLYEDSAAFCTYAGRNSVGVIIDSAEIVGALRQLYELAWGNAQQ